MGMPEHFICLLRNLYEDQETIVKTHRLFQIWKGVGQWYILSPCLFNFYADYIMWNAKLDEAQAEIKRAGRNISNFRDSDDIILMAESKEEQKSLLMRVKKIA